LSPCASLTLSFATITIVRDRINTNQSSFTHSLLTTSYFTNLTAFLFCFSSVVLQLLQVLRLPSLPSFCIYNSLYLPGSVLFCVSRLLSVYTTLCSFRRLYSSVSLALYLCLQLCVALCSFRCSRTSPAMRAATNSRAGFTRSFEHFEIDRSSSIGHGTLIFPPCGPRESFESCWQVQLNPWYRPQCGCSHWASLLHCV
jgi:hypothetical protein